MNRWINRRGLAVLGVVLGTQLLSACVIVPRPHHRSHVVVVEPGHHGPPPAVYRDGRDGHGGRR